MANVRGYTELSEESMLKVEAGQCPFCGNTDLGKRWASEIVLWCYKCQSEWELCYQFVGIRVLKVPKVEG